MKLIAVDPGEMCGVFRLTRNDEPQQVEQAPYDCVAGAERFIRLNVHLREPPPTIIVERYTFTSTKMTPQYDALEVIGALRYLAGKYECPFVMQSRADKDRVANAVLRVMGWYLQTKDGHANDAARHALMYMVRNHKDHPAVRQALGII